MQVITFTGQTVGSVDWELPSALAKELGNLSDEEQASVREMMAMEAEGLLNLLLAAIQSGRHAGSFLERIVATRKTLAAEMLQELTS